AVGRPRPDRPLAEGAGAAADPRSPPRSPRAPGPDGRRAAAARRVPGGTGRPVASGLLPSEPTPSRRRTMNATDLVDRANLRDDIPDFAPGDTLKVHVRVVEGNRERVQVFQGVVIRRKGSGARETFTVRKVSFGVGVERTFPVHSPIIARIEVMSRDDVPMFAYVVETERRFYLTNAVEMDVKNEQGRVYFELNLQDAWVWDMYRPARFVANVRVVTFKDVNVEELAGKDL